MVCKWHISHYVNETIREDVIDQYDRGMPVSMIADRIYHSSYVPRGRAKELCEYIIVDRLRRK